MCMYSDWSVKYINIYFCYFFLFKLDGHYWENHLGSSVAVDFSSICVDDAECDTQWIAFGYHNKAQLQSLAKKTRPAVLCIHPGHVLVF